MNNYKKIAGDIDSDIKSLRKADNAIKKLWKQIEMRGIDFMAECEECGKFTYVNDEKECLSCQQKKLKDGPLLLKKCNLEEKTRKLEDLQLKMQEILGKSKP